MKSVLYVAAALMIGASIYGFVDYSKTKKTKEFDTMYAEKRKADMVVVEEKKPVSDIVAAGTKEEAVVAKKEEAKTEKVNESGVKKTNPKVKKKKKLNYKSFSRAALREDEIVELPEVKDIQLKEQ